MYIANRGSRIFTILLPYFLLAVAALGLTLNIVLRRIDLLVISLVLIIPLAAAAVILLVRRNSEISPLALPAFVGHISFTHLFLASTLLIISSLIILMSNSERPIVYFALISLYPGLLLLQILCRRPGWTDKLILLEIIFYSLNLAWGATLKYPLYFADSDILPHMYIIDTILKTSHSQTYDIIYQYYPLYHIFSAVGIEITGLSIKTSIFIIMGIAWQAAIISGFVIFRRISNSDKIAAIGCLLMASSSQVIFYGTYPIARALAFVFLTGWLVLILNRKAQDLRYFLLSLIIMAAMILAHHLNIVQVIPILLVVYFCQLLFNRKQPNQPFEPLYIFLFAFCCLSYLVWVAASMSGPHLASVVQEIVNSDFAFSSNPTAGYGFSTIWGIIYYSFVLLLCLLGLQVLINHLKSTESNRIGAAFAIGGFVLLAVFIPGPLDLLPFSKSLLVTRLSLMVTPFVIFLMIYGIIYLIDIKISFRTGSPGMGRLSIIPAVFVVLMSFFSNISIGNALDNNDFPHTSIMKTPYFTEAEMTSFSFLNDKGVYSLPIYADYQTTRVENILYTYTRFIFTGGDISYIQNGYLVFREREMERKKALTFSVDGFGMTSYRYHLEDSETELNNTANLGSRDRIYSDGSVRIFEINKNAENPEDILP